MWEIESTRDINNHGVILADARQTLDAAGLPIPPASQTAEPVLLYPVDLTSEDRFVKGAIRIPEGAIDFSLSFRATAENGLDLGTFAKLEPGAAESPTYIYDSAEDILSEQEQAEAVAGTLDPRANTQPVVFHRDAEDPRRLHFATAFDQVGDIEITLSYGSESQRVTGKLVHTLVAQAEAAGLLSTLDQRIESIDIPEVVDFDLDLDGDGIPDGGASDLITAAQPGTTNAPGPFVAEKAEDDPLNLVLLVNSDDDNADATIDFQHPTLDAADDDLSQIILRSPKGVTTGTLTLTHTGGPALRLRFPTGPPLASGASVDLAAPTGDLAVLAAGPLTVYAEGLAPATNVTITLAYTPAGELEPTVSDSVSLIALDPSALAALQTRHRHFARPGDIGGLLSRSYATNGAYRQHRLGLAPIGENLPLQNRGLLAKTLLPISGGIKVQAAYFRGIADGFWFGLKSDGESLGDAFFYVFMEDNRLIRARAIATQFKELALAYYTTPPPQRPVLAVQLGITLVRGLYTEAEAALGWEPLQPGLDPQVVTYMAGIGTGFVTQQIAVALIPVGGTAVVLTGKVGLVLRGVIAANATGQRYVLPTLDAVVQTSAKVTQALRRTGRTEEEVRNAVHGAQMARRVELPGGLKAPQQVDELFKAKPQLREDILRIWQDGLPTEAGSVVVAGSKRFAYMEADLARFLRHFSNEADLSEDAVKGFAYFQGRLFKTGEDSASRWADCEKLFGGLDTPAKKNALKESLIAYKWAVEVDPEAKFIIKNITAISPTAYRYNSRVPNGSWASFTGDISGNPDGYWCTFDLYNNKYIATDRLLLPLQSSAPLYRYEFATSAVAEKSRIPRGSGDTESFFEPLTRDEPDDFIGAGTSVKGKATQFKSTDIPGVQRVIDMDTGLQVWP